ncbi:hypothetical protein BGW80DRAFT_1281012 [Lactifluus volemus]|nr:hypothetical protein BGW80DRAFT_1281012 [Lactifluus volemus]
MSPTRSERSLLIGVVVPARLRLMRPTPFSTRSMIPTGKSRGSESKSRERGGRRARTKDEDQRNSSNLKALLQITRDRLETETRRADAAESRAMLAEARTREVTSRSTTVEQASHRSELDAARAQEETKRAQMQLETAERELRRVTAELQRVTRQKDESDNAAAKARDLARKWQSALRDYQAHDEGRQEGIRLALIRRYDDGREDGWEEGHTEGWDAGKEEGFLEGRKTGFEEGREMGRREERLVVRPNRWKDVPPRSFEESERVYPDRSLFSKARSEQSLERTRTWVESIVDESIHSHSPKPAAAWLRRTPELLLDE